MSYYVTSCISFIEQQQAALNLMMMKHNFMKKLATIFVVLITILSMVIAPSAQACSRLVYNGGSNGPITARSMDWFQDPDAELWFFPKGLDRNGGAGDNSIKWTSKYASIVTSSYDIATVDGINDQGLVVNLLFLTTTNYGEIEQSENTLSVGGWGQYVLDNYKDVNEALTGLTDTNLQIATTTLNGLNELRPGTIPPALLAMEVEGQKFGDMNFGLHMAISDKSGDSAVIEYINGEQEIHHGPQYNVLTNDPTYDQQLELDESWNNLNTFWSQGGALSFVPGSSNATDRFIRASYYLKQMNDKLVTKLRGSRRNELAAALGIIRNVSDPIGLASFNVGTTQWRTLGNQSVPSVLGKITNDPNPTYFFEYTKNPSVFWADINKLKSKSKNDAMVFDKVTDPTFAGDVSQEFEGKDPFSWDISSNISN
ncbi:linear amide C-N hydrolase [Okeania sp. SIO2B9]|uniref:linear amide C-N hydrolase n=1 Tax=Okeania sp. SIO2B9 TaxID=2607782 RepID=UPI00142B42F8|nr:linear amide C-N hydrolase [Okeania sp. SIO2B9]NES90759.1 linear amide C-N hydrolase [Okeania sp. SIO2B9]